MLQVNEVLKMDETLYRILVIFLEDIAWIPIEGDKVFPSIITKSELCTGQVQPDTFFREFS